MKTDKRGMRCISSATVSILKLRAASPATSIGNRARPPSVQVEGWSGDSKELFDADCHGWQ